MILQLTKEELETFHAKVGKWYNDQATYVLPKLVECSRFEPRREDYQRLCKEFESKNPQPSWKDLL